MSIPQFELKNSNISIDVENAPAGLQMLSFLANSLRAIKHVTCFQVWLVFFLLTLTLHSYSKYDCLLNLLSRENVMQCFGLDIAL